MPKLDEIFPTVAVIFCYYYLRETVHKQDKGKKKKRKRIVAFVNWKMPKLAQPRKSVGKFVVVHFFSCIKRIC